jgi:hypothetical protein
MTYGIKLRSLILFASVIMVNDGNPKSAIVGQIHKI